MAQQNINIGSSANKGDGDPIRTAFSKAENNFTDLYTRIITVEAQSGVTNPGGSTIQQSIIGDVIGNDSTIIVNHATSTVTAQNIVGNLKGSVVADDSTVIIDGVSGTIPYSVLSGTPTIPTNNNTLTNGAGFITASSTEALTNKSGNVSMFTNDSNYLTAETITLTTLKTEVAASTDFADFQTRIAAL
jgi:hypothetical protein